MDDLKGIVLPLPVPGSPAERHAVAGAHFQLTACSKGRPRSCIEKRALMS